MEANMLLNTTRRPKSSMKFPLNFSRGLIAPPSPIADGPHGQIFNAEAPSPYVMDQDFSVSSNSDIVSFFPANDSSSLPEEDSARSSPEIMNATLMPEDMRFTDSSVIFIACYSAILVVSLVGNLCVLRAILGGSKRHRKSRVNFMLLHLAIADLIVTTIMIPGEVAWSATVEWVAGDAACRLFAFFRIFGHYLSSFILVCISIDRFFAVVYPLSLSAAARRGKLMLAMAWFLAFTCSTPQIIIFHVENHHVYTRYVQCVTFHFFPSDQHEMVYNLFCLIMLYLAPLFIIVLSYGAIVVTIVQKTKLSTDENNIRRSGIGYLGRAKVRTIKMTISIVAAFFICWTPYVVISFWFCIDKKAASSLDLRVQKCLFVFACTNSCANPLVYGIFNFCKRKKPEGQRTLRSSTAHSHLHHSSMDIKSLKTSARCPAAALEMRNRTPFRYGDAKTFKKNPEESELCIYSGLGKNRKRILLSRKSEVQVTSLREQSSELPAIRPQYRRCHSTIGRANKSSDEAVPKSASPVQSPHVDSACAQDAFDSSLKPANE